MSARSTATWGPSALQSRQIGLYEGKRQYRGPHGCRRGCGELARLGELARGLPQQRRQQRGDNRRRRMDCALCSPARAARARAARVPTLVRRRAAADRPSSADCPISARQGASWPPALPRRVRPACRRRQAAGLELVLVGVDDRDEHIRGQAVSARRRAHGIGDGIAGCRVGRCPQRVAPPLQADVAERRLAHGARDAGDLAVERRQRQQTFARGTGASSAAR